MRSRMAQASFFMLIQIFSIDIDVAALSLCLSECICRSGSWYLHQSRFPDRSLCYIVNSAFVSAVLVAAVDLSALDNHEAH
jgi:hypothetical protein